MVSVWLVVKVSPESRGTAGLVRPAYRCSVKGLVSDAYGLVRFFLGNGERGGDLGEDR